MSLVGNLEDLSLGDILQIISLSQKSGVLALSSDLGSGRIVFRSGMVQASCLKGEPNDLRELLIGAAVIDPAGYDAALARARDLSASVEDTLSSEAGITREKIDELVTKAAETSVLEMFSWPAGDFSFDVRTELDPEDPHLILPMGINAQYLAMEGLRLRDERLRDGDGEPAVDPNAETDPNIGTDEDPLFGAGPVEVDPLGEMGGVPPVLEVEAVEAPGDELLLEAPPWLEGEDPVLGEAPSAADVVVGSVLEREEDPNSLSIDEVAKAPPLGPDADAGDATREDPVEEPSDAEIAPTEPVAESLPAAEVTPWAPEASALPVEDARRMPVVLIDPDVGVLEWVRAAIEDDFARVHMFQKADQGLTRIRQYLIRGETPLVLVSPETPVDPLSGIHGLSDFVKRLKAQSPRIVVLGLREGEDVAPVAMPGILNGVLRRPPRRLLADKSSPERATASQVLARALLQILAQQGGPRSKAANKAESLRGLRDATAMLQEASSRGEILPVVLDFASEIFTRAAILVVRDDDVFAVAGRGISTLEVDPLRSASPVTIPTPASGWIRRVLDSGEAFVGAATEDSDRLLLECLGGEVPKRAYLGRIESGDVVTAMLYADQSTSEAPMPDTHALEVVLHHAGLALDRVALERALWEAAAEAD
jgi:hypothetical protein